MPYTYPPAAPTLTGDLLTINRFLTSPTLLERRLRTLAENRFIADALLTGRYVVEGGAVLYETGESIYTDREPRPVAPGGEYPLSTAGDGVAQLAAVQKWGQDVEVTDEAIKRRRMSPVERALQKIVNQMVKKIDSISLAAIASAVTQTRAATAAWSGSTAAILRDIQLAKADVLKLNEGYDPDTVVVDDTTYAYITSDDKIIQAARRESGDSPVYSGEFPVIGGLRILPTPNLPTTGTALVLDSRQLGGMADEDLGGPGYTGRERGVQGKAIRDDDNDQWRLRGRRVTVPIVQEPKSAITITGI